VPLDPWGKPYIYRYPGAQGDDYDLLSYGKDGQPGGTGEDADLSNH
jgi:general secretion pathway protein G